MNDAKNFSTLVRRLKTPGKARFHESPHVNQKFWRKYAMEKKNSIVEGLESLTFMSTNVLTD